MKKTLLTPILLFLQFSLHAQTMTTSNHQNGYTSFPELIFADIPGAPKLSTPQLITGVISEGHGLAAPAFYDWDGDGLKDLLIGEFGSGIEKGTNVGNFIRIYKNTGTPEKPEFSDVFDYARPPFKLPGNGTPYSVDQFCCIGFTPQFIDLNNDSLQDMITGSYYGEVYWFEGSKEGFKAGVSLPQDPPEEGDPRNGLTAKKAHQFYWLYSSASFGDFTGDGKPDLITGGTMALHISKNIGTEREPRFAQREMLLDVHGDPLKIYEYTPEQLKFYEDRKILGYKAPIAGDDHLSPFVTDWDNDGTPDLLVTNSYMHKGLSTVDFFKGVKTKDGIRFQPAVALFTAKQDGKAFPGMGPRVSVTDYNNDGIKDLLVGASIVNMNGRFNERFSWQWHDDNQLLPAGKDNGLVAERLSGKQLENFKKQFAARIPKDVRIEDYLTIRHQGAVYVLLGK